MNFSSNNILGPNDILETVNVAFAPRVLSTGLFTTRTMVHMTLVRHERRVYILQPCDDFSIYSSYIYINVQIANM